MEGLHREGTRYHAWVRVTPCKGYVTMPGLGLDQTSTVSSTFRVLRVRKGYGTMPGLGSALVEIFHRPNSAILVDFYNIILHFGR